MAKSRFEYTREFEQADIVLPQTWMVVRIDGRGFTLLTANHRFEKPNDIRGIRLMNAAARRVMDGLPDVLFSYGQSDEYSFVLGPACSLFRRRRAKIMSTIVSLFTAAYCTDWPAHFPGQPLGTLPTFDGRLVVYPNFKTVRDYLSWRQADCHINNLFNTCFWKMVNESGQPPKAAHTALARTTAAEKNELLFSSYHLNYNTIDPVFRKGTFQYRTRAYTKPERRAAKQAAKGPAKGPAKQAAKGPAKGPGAAPTFPENTLFSTHEDIIGDAFWNQHQHCLFLP